MSPQSQVQNFVTAVKPTDAENAELEIIVFQINGIGPNGSKTEHYELALPDDTAIALYAAAFAGDKPSLQDVIKATLDFFSGSLTEAHMKDVLRRLKDRADPTGIETLQDIIEWAMEEYTGFPTQPSSASTSPSRSGGRSGTAPSPIEASTPSSSRRVASRTRSTTASSRR